MSQRAFLIRTRIRRPRITCRPNMAARSKARSRPKSSRAGAITSSSSWPTDLAAARPRSLVSGRAAATLEAKGGASMLIHVRTDNHIEGREQLASEVTKEVEAALGRFAPQLTRVEVYLADENSHKTSDNDKRCTIEARLSG